MSVEIGDYSMGEITARAKLAIRGLGYSWGVAEDGAHAIAWLERHELPGLMLLSRLCEHIEHQLLDPESHHSLESGLRPQSLMDDWSARHGELCPILTGISLSDAGFTGSAHAEINIHDVMFPLLLLPFVADVALRIKSVVRLDFDHSFVCCDETSLRFGDVVSALSDNNGAGAASLLGRGVTLSVSVQAPGASAAGMQWLNSQHRVVVEPSVWALLGRYAHRTYAPATEESRLLGAGAGVTDND